MPTYDPDLAGVLRSLQRQIDQINTSRPGPTSYGPGDHVRFYDADGNVLFQANSGGASVVSRGSLTSMTGLFDGIRDKSDAQDGVLSDHRTWLVGHGERLDGHDQDVSRIDGVNAAQSGRLNDQHEWIGSLGTRIGDAEGRLSGHDSTLSSHNSRISTAQSRADNAHDDAAVGISIAQGAAAAANTAQARADNAHDDAAVGISLAQGAASAASTAQARADSAYTRASTGISNAATAQARANAAYSLAEGRATQAQIAGILSTLSTVASQISSLGSRVDALEAWKRSLT